MRYVTCKVCNIEFKSEGTRKYCSNECKNIAMIFNHECQICGKEYTTKKSKTSGYCSKECSKIYNLQKRSKELESQEDILRCKECDLLIGKSIITHITNFHNMSVEEYKAKHNVGAEAIFAESTRTILRENVSGEKNVWYNHCGTLSPFSKNNPRITEEQRLENLSNIIENRTNNGNGTTDIRRYLKETDGNEEEARKLLKERQSTFSLDKCIKNYGEEEGLKKWQERQDKWQTTLLSKSEEEIAEINSLKIVGKASKISQELFNKIDLNGARYHSKNGELGIRLKTNKIVYPDFIFNSKIIEFYGDKWHANPKSYKPNDLVIFLNSKRKQSKTAKEIWEQDENRINELKKLGYSIKIIWEQDYRNNKEQVIEECKQFLQN